MNFLDIAYTLSKVCDFLCLHHFIEKKTGIKYQNAYFIASKHLVSLQYDVNTSCLEMFFVLLQNISAL